MLKIDVESLNHYDWGTHLWQLHENVKKSAPDGLISYIQTVEDRNAVITAVDALHKALTSLKLQPELGTNRFAEIADISVEEAKLYDVVDLVNADGIATPMIKKNDLLFALPIGTERIDHIDGSEFLVFDLVEAVQKGETDRFWLRGLAENHTYFVLVLDNFFRSGREYSTLDDFMDKVLRASHKMSDNVDVKFAIFDPSIVLSYKPFTFLRYAKSKIGKHWTRIYTPSHFFFGDTENRFHQVSEAEFKEANKAVTKWLDGLHMEGVITETDVTICNTFIYLFTRTPLSLVQGAYDHTVGFAHDLIKQRMVKADKAEYTIKYVTDAFNKIKYHNLVTNLQK